MSDDWDDDGDVELDDNGEVITKKKPAKKSPPPKNDKAKKAAPKKKVEDDWDEEEDEEEVRDKKNNKKDNNKKDNKKDNNKKDNKKDKKKNDDWGDEDDNWGDGNDGGWENENEGNEAWGNENENEDGEENWEIQCENLFFTAESDRKDDPNEALKKFQECIQIEEEKSKKIIYRFKAITHIIILLYQLKKVQDMIKNYKKLLSYANDVSPNDLNDAIRTILNTVQQEEIGKNNNNNNNNSALGEMYEITLEYFKGQPGKEHFWFDYAMRLCKTYLERKDKKCEQLLEELHKSCKIPSTGQDDPAKGAQLLEIYAIKIQIMTRKNTNRIALNELFEKTNQLFADINDPRSMSVIKECWGKMYASMNQWNDAYSNFFDAFRSYQDIGHANVRQCLKYVVIASMLSDVDTNPFATQEARVYQQHIDIIPVATLLDAFETDNITLFEKTLASKKNILDDDFIKENINAVLLRLRSKVLVKLIKPYKRVKLQWLCKQLNSNMDEVENLIVNLILDGSIQGKLDQIHSLLDLNSGGESDKLYYSMDQWMSSVKRVQNTIIQRSTRYDNEFGAAAGGGGGRHGGFMGMMDGGGGGGAWDGDQDDVFGLTGDDFDSFGGHGWM